MNSRGLGKILRESSLGCHCSRMLRVVFADLLIHLWRRGCLSFSSQMLNVFKVLVTCCYIWRMYWLKEMKRRKLFECYSFSVLVPRSPLISRSIWTCAFIVTFVDCGVKCAVHMPALNFLLCQKMSYVVVLSCPFVMRMFLLSSTLHILL